MYTSTPQAQAQAHAHAQSRYPHETNPLIPAPEGDEDPSELSAMISCQPYNGGDKYVARIRDSLAAKVWEANHVVDMGERMDTLRGLMRMGEEVWIVQGFFFEYGFNIEIGSEVFVGANCTFLDVGPITIGTRSMLGPNCQLLTPGHPVSPEARNGLKGKEWARPVTIGDDCWLGAGVIVCPGVTVGNGSTIGAGSVVTKDVPERSVVVGNPGRVIKHINADGSLENVN